jgi:hypothetical protein
VPGSRVARPPMRTCCLTPRRTRPGFSPCCTQALLIGTFPPGPLSSGRWVFPSPAGSQRLSAAAFPKQRPRDGRADPPSNIDWSSRVGTPPSPRLDPRPTRPCGRGADSSLEEAVARADPRGHGHARPEALCSGGVVLSPPSSLVRPQPPVSAPPDDFPPHGYTPGLLPYGRVLAWHGDLPRFEPPILAVVPPPIRRGARRVPVSDFFPADTGLRPFARGSALPAPQLALSTPTRGALGGVGNDAAAFA